MKVEPHCSIEELDTLIKKAKDSKSRQRLRIIRWAMDRLSAPAIAKLTGLSRRRVQEWVRRFNLHGLTGLKDQSGRGRHAPLTPEQQTVFIARLEAGPQPVDRVCALRGLDFQRILKEEFQVLRSLTAVYDLLHSLGYSCLMPRPRHRQADPARQEQFKKKNYQNNWQPFNKHIRTKN